MSIGGGIENKCKLFVFESALRDRPQIYTDLHRFTQIIYNERN